MELSYVSNERSLFKKYAYLVTWFANTPIGKAYLGINEIADPISLFLPNGYHVVKEQYKHGFYGQATLYARPIFSRKLTPLLIRLDAIAFQLKSFKEAQELLLYMIGLNPKVPDIYNHLHLLTRDFNPDADPETTTFDGYALTLTGGSNFATIRAASGTSSGASDATGGFAYLDTGSASYNTMVRSFYLFDTSTIRSSMKINSTLFRIYIVSKSDVNSQSVRLVQSTTASNTAVANSDYQGTVGNTTAQATDITVASLTTSAYNDFTLNSTGIGNITRGGITKFGGKLVSDAANSDPLFPIEQVCSIVGNYADAGSNKPILQISYASQGGGIF